MWRSTSDRRPRRHDEPRRCGPARGFTLLEAMVSLLLLVIVLIVAMTMLFQMRAFAERQQYFMLPRQAARRAADYLSYYFAGASDINYVDSTHPSPNALIMYYNSGTPGVVTQASYNNLGCPDSIGTITCTEPNNFPLPAQGLRPANTSTAFGDIGTDVITMVAPSGPGRYQASAPFPAFGTNLNLWFNFRVGCPSDVQNLNDFRIATGDDGVTGSALLMFVDKTGSWSYVQIPTGSYVASNCADPFPPGRNINVTPVNTAAADLPAPPNPSVSPVSNLTDPVYLVTGLQVISFRILTDDITGFPTLQQKLGLFDPLNDNPYPPVGSLLPAFTNVMENVEDLQVAYMYSQNAASGLGNNPLVWNTASQTISSAAPGCALLPGPGCDTHIPYQAGPNFNLALPPLDISNVIGVRFSVTGRSPLLPLAAQKLTDIDVKKSLALTTSQHFRPASEDHPVTMDPGNTTWPLYDKFDHYRQTATLMLRNRIPRG